MIVPENLEDLTEQVIGCAIAVHRALGPGLLESAYRECLMLELQASGLRAERERRVAIIYRGVRISTHLRIDLLVEDCVVVELKAVDRPNPVYLAQVMTYLKLADCPAGLLMNFNTPSLRSQLRRLTHPDLYGRKTAARDRAIENGRPR